MLLAAVRLDHCAIQQAQSLLSIQPPRSEWPLSCAPVYGRDSDVTSGRVGTSATLAARSPNSCTQHNSTLPMRIDDYSLPSYIPSEPNQTLLCRSLLLYHKSKCLYLYIYPTLPLTPMWMTIPLLRNRISSLRHADRPFWLCCCAEWRGSFGCAWGYGGCFLCWRRGGGERFAGWHSACLFRLVGDRFRWRGEVTHFQLKR